MKFKAEIKVILKEGIKDSHGLAVESVLKSTNIASNVKVKTGKFYNIVIETESKEEALDKINEICKKVMVNTDLEKYEIINIDEEKDINYLISELAS